MGDENQEKMGRAKSWCFDNGITESEIQAAWDKAKEANHIIKNLNEHGKTWWWLPEHLLKQLIERHSSVKGAIGI